MINTHTHPHATNVSYQQEVCFSNTLFSITTSKKRSNIFTDVCLCACSFIIISIEFCYNMIIQKWPIFSIIFLPIKSWKLLLWFCVKWKSKTTILYMVFWIYLWLHENLKTQKKSHFGCHSKSFLKTWDFVIFLIFQNNCFVHKQISIQIFYPRFLYMKLFFYNNDYVFFPGRKESKNERVNVHFFLSILLLYDTWTILLLVIFFSCGRKLNLDS